MNRQELADYLRNRRARLRPQDVGLPDGVRRRTPGLRRQEVAQLAGMSVEYYIRLEQARGPRPSRQILNALGRALMLTMDERAHLFHLAGETVSPAGRPDRDVPSGIRHLLAAMSEQPAYVIDANYDILAWNDLATEFIGDLSAPGVDRNMVRWIFRSPMLREHLQSERHRDFIRSAVADLRAASALYPDDEGIARLVDELRRESPEFVELWSDHDVAVRRSLCKYLDHPVVGPIHIECQVLLVPERNQRLVVYTTEPGSPSWDAMRRLRELRAMTTVESAAGAAGPAAGETVS
ncbi:MAG: helix-turn-helix domain-containing protein [Hamadaea sp.]|nr:helix-turn-helix domain-containing protein [Hamadaea sp.]